MQSAFIFITCETIATLAILSALYGLARDRKPKPARALVSYRRVRFRNFR